MPRCGCKLCGGAHARKRTPPTYSPGHSGRRVAAARDHSRDGVALRHETLDPDFDALHRRVNKARSPRRRRSPRRGHAKARSRFGARASRPAPGVRRRSGSGARGTLCKLRVESRAPPARGGRGRPRSRATAMSAKGTNRGAPGPSDERRAVRRAGERRDERSDERHLGHGHPHVGRHLEGAQLDESLGAHGGAGSNSLSMQISARCVLPATSTSRCRNSASQSHGGDDSLPGSNARARAISSS